MCTVTSVSKAVGADPERRNHLLHQAKAQCVLDIIAQQVDCRAEYSSTLWICPWTESNQFPALRQTLIRETCAGTLMSENEQGNTTVLN